MLSRLRLPLLLLALFALLAGCGTNNDQPPFTQAEFATFVSDALLINNEMLSLSTLYGVTDEPDATARMRDKAHAAIRKAGWDLDRFYYIYKRCVVYGTYENARRQAGQREAELARSASRDHTVRAEYESARKNHTLALSILREKLDRDIHMSEQAVIHERIDEVMLVVTRSAIHFPP